MPYFLYIPVITALIFLSSQKYIYEQDVIVLAAHECAALLSTIGSFKLCPLSHPTLLHADKEAAERLSKTVDEACLLLAEYNGRLAAELEDRRQLARMLIEYTQNQKDVLTEKEKKLEVSACYWGWQNNWLTKHSP